MLHVEHEEADGWHLNMLVALIHNANSPLVRRALIRALKYVVESDSPDQIGFIAIVADNIMYGRDAEISRVIEADGDVDEMFRFNEIETQWSVEADPSGPNADMITEGDVEEFMRQIGESPSAIDPFDNKEKE